MYDSDEKYLSRFALDPEVEYGSEDLSEMDFSGYANYDNALGPLDGEDLDPENLILEDDFLFEN